MLCSLRFFFFTATTTKKKDKEEKHVTSWHLKAFLVLIIFLRTEIHLKDFFKNNLKLSAQVGSNIIFLFMINIISLLVIIFLVIYWSFYLSQNMYLDITCYVLLLLGREADMQCLRNTGTLLWYMIQINKTGTVLFCLLGAGITSSFYVLQMNNVNFQMCLFKHSMRAGCWYPRSS